MTQNIIVFDKSVPSNIQFDQAWRIISKQPGSDRRNNPFGIITQMLPAQDKSPHFWWQTTGSALATLLEKSDSTLDHSIRSLVFYHSFVCPYLGQAPMTSSDGSTRPSWRSFMTDDFTPVELSWSWGVGHAPPAVRYSFEPIGPLAGTEVDPLNAHSATDFMNELKAFDPSLNLN